MKNLSTATYNERLFDGGGVRGFLHSARFRWFAATLQRLKMEPDSVCELGCYDGKLINHLPRAPRRYVGFDANWENGLEAAAELWRGHPEYSFRLCRSPNEMTLGDSERFDVCVVMETLEHLSTEMLSAYLERLSRHTTGYVLITVPNEKGPVFLAKWAIKRLLSGDAHTHTLSELCNATLGRMDRVERHEHKGFDYRELIRQVSRHFDVVDVAGIPTRLLPTWMSFGIGIVATPRRPLHS